MMQFTLHMFVGAIAGIGIAAAQTNYLSADVDIAKKYNYDYVWASDEGWFESPSYADVPWTDSVWAFEFSTFQGCVQGCNQKGSQGGAYGLFARPQLCICQRSVECLEPKIVVRGGVIFSTRKMPNFCPLDQSFCDNWNNDQKAYCNDPRLEIRQPSSLLNQSASPSLQQTSFIKVQSPQPTPFPTLSPTLQTKAVPPVYRHTLPPAPQPTLPPTVQPTEGPSAAWSAAPSTPKPTLMPSDAPSQSPSVHPTRLPSAAPSTIPSIFPSLQPSIIPTVTPSSAPSAPPTTIPRKISFGMGFTVDIPKGDNYYSATASLNLLSEAEEGRLVLYTSDFLKDQLKREFQYSGVLLTLVMENRTLDNETQHSFGARQLLRGATFNAVRRGGSKVNVTRSFIGHVALSGGSSQNMHGEGDISVLVDTAFAGASASTFVDMVVAREASITSTSVLRYLTSVFEFQTPPTTGTGIIASATSDTPQDSKVRRNSNKRVPASVATGVSEAVIAGFVVIILAFMVARKRRQRGTAVTPTSAVNIENVDNGSAPPQRKTEIESRIGPFAILRDLSNVGRELEKIGRGAREESKGLPVPKSSSASDQAHGTRSKPEKGLSGVSEELQTSAGLPESTVGNHDFYKTGSASFPPVTRFKHGVPAEPIKRTNESDGKALNSAIIRDAEEGGLSKHDEEDEIDQSTMMQDDSSSSWFSQDGGAFFSSFHGAVRKTDDGLGRADQPLFQRIWSMFTPCAQPRCGPQTEQASCNLNGILEADSDDDISFAGTANPDAGVFGDKGKHGSKQATVSNDLHLLVKTKSWTELETLLKDLASLGSTVMERKKKSNIEFMLRQGDETGRTPLSIACGKSSAPSYIIVEMLKSSPRCGTIPDSHQNLPIHHFCHAYKNSVDETEVLRLLDESCPQGVKSLNAYGNLPLHIYVEHKCGRNMDKETLSIALDLIDMYPEATSAKNDEDSYPIHYVAKDPKYSQSSQMSRDSVAEQLTLFSALYKASPKSFRAQNKFGATPFFYCVVYNLHRKLWTEMISQFPQSARLTTTDGATPISIFWNMFVSSTARKRYLSVDSVESLAEGAIVEQHRREMKVIKSLDQMKCASPDLQDFWGKMEIMLRASDRTASSRADRGKNDRWQIVHTICAHDDSPCDLLKFALHLYPSQVAQVDMSGNTPLHLVARHSASTTQRHAENAHSMIKELLPHGISTPNRDGRLPLHLAILSGKSWCNGVRTLHEANTSAVRERDPLSGLFPFLMAALMRPKHSRKDINEDKIEEHNAKVVEVEHDVLNTTYELLKAAPELILNAS